MGNITNLRLREREHGHRLIIDRFAREVMLGDTKIELTATEFDILAFLENNPHQVVTYTEVIEAVWGNAAHFERHALEVQVSRLRTKLGESGSRPYFIETVRGYGYRFKKGDSTTHLASIHYDCHMEIISSWVANRSGLMPPPPPASREEEVWIAQWIDQDEIDRMASCASAMFEMGLREATGNFMTIGDQSVRQKVHVVATIAERDKQFDGMYAEFFSAGYFLDT